MRPYQWSKNCFIFAPAFFAFGSYPLTFIKPLIISFFGFSLVCSAIYIFNDILDRESDKLHPSKKFRPIASALISPYKAGIFSIFLMGGGLIMLYVCLSSLSPKPNFSLFIPVCFYICLNFVYSTLFKHFAIIDIFCIAIGFVLRLFIGSIVINIALSEWIVIVTFLLALFLALAKRRDDVIILEKSGTKMRKNIDGYNHTFLDIGMSISASLVMISYIFYTIDESVQERFHTDKLYFTSIFVLLGIFRYMQITFVEEQSSSPSKILLKDRFLQCAILGYICSFVVIIILK